MESTLFFVLGIFSISLATQQFHWGYHGDSGPSHWAQHYKDCGGNRQSPINIPKEEEVEYAKHLGFIKFDGFGDVRVHTITNNGHTLQVDVKGDSYIRGGGLGGLYKATQFHFHWGRTSDRGSEHTFNGIAFPMEMHIVHYNIKYGSISEALGKSDGLAVLGFMFKVIPFDNIFYKTFLKRFPYVQYSGKSTFTSPMRLVDILPISWQKMKFFRYDGSLTTPPCSEAVIWSVFTSPIFISEKQLKQFRKLYSNELSSETYEHISDNFRPVQPLNNRRVLKNTPAI